MSEPSEPAGPDVPDVSAPEQATLDSRIAWLKRGVWVVLLLGVVSFLVRGADNPDDPSLGTSDVAAGSSPRVSTNDRRLPTTSVTSAPDGSASSTTSAPGATSTSGAGSSGGPSDSPGRPGPTLPATDLDPAPTVLVPAPGPEPEPASPPVGNPDRRPLEGFPEVVFRIDSRDGGTFDGLAMLADDTETRGQGLMEQTDLRGYDAMIFRFQSASTGGFYMRKTLIPLSIAFFNVNGGFISSADMEPCPDSQPDCPTTRAGAPYFHAIEVPQGDLERLGIGPGSVLSFPR